MCRTTNKSSGNIVRKPVPLLPFMLNTAKVRCGMNSTQHYFFVMIETQHHEEKKSEMRHLSMMALASCMFSFELNTRRLQINAYLKVRSVTKHNCIFTGNQEQSPRRHKKTDDAESNDKNLK